MKGKYRGIRRMVSMFMAANSDVTIEVTGRSQDIVGLSRVFDGSANTDFVVRTCIEHETINNGFLQVASNFQAFGSVEGDGVKILCVSKDPRALRSLAKQALEPMNACAKLLNPNYRDVLATKVTVSSKIGDWSVNLYEKAETTAIVTMGWHESHRTMLSERVKLVQTNPIVYRVVSKLSQTPSWTNFYRIFEDIAEDQGTSINQLHSTGFLTPVQNNQFKKAANSSRKLEDDPRHGLAKISFEGDPSELMNISEAYQLTRDVVNKWINEKVGNILPREVIDYIGSGPMRWQIGEDYRS